VRALLAVFVVVTMLIDLRDGKVAKGSIVDGMMLVLRDHDSVVDLAGDVLLSRFCTYFEIKYS